MLDINEYNKLLYKQLDRKAEEKSIISDYGNYLRHSKSKETESGIELQAATWLANFRGLTTSNGFLKTPQGMKEICEGLIPQASKLLRKANKKGAPEETKAELRNARKFLEDCLADANAALQHSDEDPNHLTHGEKWRKHKYIAIENGRYIYPEDRTTQFRKKNYNNPSSALIGGNNVRNKAFAVDYHQSKADAGNEELERQKEAGRKQSKSLKAWTESETNLANARKKELADTIKAENLMRDVTKAEKKQKEEYQESHANAIAFNEQKKQARETAAKGEKREQVLKQISESKEIDDYAKEIAAAYEKGLIKMDRHKTSGGFDTTKENWRETGEYDALLAAADKAEEYCKKVAEESNGATDWYDVRKELEERILRPIIDKYTNKQKAGNAMKAVKEAEDRERWKREKVQHSDNSPSMAATAMSRDEYEELLKKAESLT